MPSACMLLLLWHLPDDEISLLLILPANTGRNVREPTNAADDDRLRCPPPARALANSGATTARHLRAIDDTTLRRMVMLRPASAPLPTI